MVWNKRKWVIKRDKKKVDEKRYKSAFALQKRYSICLKLLKV